MTPDQMFESFRKSATSSWQLQQEVLKQWAQQWPSFGTPDSSADWAKQFQKRWTEFSSEYLTRSRESLETMYKMVVQFLDLTSKVSESKSPDEYRAGLEEARTKMFEAFKNQSEANLRDFQKTAEKWFEVISSKAEVTPSNPSNASKASKA
jgi:hypothetical protein